MKNMFFVKSRYDYEEEVNNFAYNCFTEMDSVEDLESEFCSAESIATEYVDCAKDVEDHIDEDFQLKETEEEAWEILEHYDYANYGIFSVLEFAEAVRDAIKALFEEAGEEEKA